MVPIYSLHPSTRMCGKGVNGIFSLPALNVVLSAHKDRKFNKKDYPTPTECRELTF